MAADPRLDKFRKLRESVLAKTAPASEAKLVADLEKVKTRAYAITDEDVAALLAAGHDQDHVFEHTVGVAMGAAIERVAAGLDALEALEKKKGGRAS